MRRSIRLWGRRSGFHARKVIWALQELGLCYELIEAGFGIAPTADFVSRNPNALAPVLDDRGTVIWESNVIVRYLCTRYSPGDLAPADGLAERFQAEQWMDWAATTFWPAIRPLHHASVLGQTLAANDKARQLGEVQRYLAVLEDHLEAQDFLATGGFGMADIPAGLAMDRLARLELPLPSFPRALAWRARLVGRPAFPQEGDTGSGR